MSRVLNTSSTFHLINCPTSLSNCFFVLHFIVFGVNFRTINGQNYSKEFFDNTSHLHISFFVCKSLKGKIAELIALFVTAVEDLFHREPSFTIG